MNIIDLSAKAELIEDYVEKYLVDQNGIIYSAINNLTGKPWTEEDFLMPLNCPVFCRGNC